MLQPKTRPATYADIEALPPHVVGEILFGVLQTHRHPVRGSFSRGALQAELMGFFGRARGSPRGWAFIGGTTLHLGPHVAVPDIAGWKRERLTPFPTTAFIATPPDWLCEMLSPPTRKVDRTDKLTVYATFGVGHCWYVDPIARTLGVLALTDGKWLLAAAFRDSDPVTAPPFEAHTFPLDVLWVPEDEAPESEA